MWFGDARRKRSGASAGAGEVWDIGIRAFHWLLVLALIGSYVSTLGGAAWMTWHVRAGYAVLGLVLFRLVWGVCGSEHARFINFVRGPRQALRYAWSLVRGRPAHYLGHNPLGGLMVLALLALLLVQSLSGLFASDGILTDGPLRARVSEATSRAVTRVHHYNFNLLWVAAGLHVAAVLAYLLFLREDLVTPMFTGRKPGAPEARRSPQVIALRLALVGGVAGLAVWAITRA